MASPMQVNIADQHVNMVLEVNMHDRVFSQIHLLSMYRRMLYLWSHQSVEERGRDKRTEVIKGNLAAIHFPR